MIINVENRKIWAIILVITALGVFLAAYGLCGYDNCVQTALKGSGVVLGNTDRAEIEIDSSLHCSTCPSCGGSCKCQVCWGSGKNTSGDNCSICSGSGKCYTCGGSGKL